MWRQIVVRTNSIPQATDKWHDWCSYLVSMSPLGYQRTHGRPNGLWKLFMADNVICTSYNYCGRQEEPAILISTLLLHTHARQLCSWALTRFLLDLWVFHYECMECKERYFRTRSTCNLDLESREAHASSIAVFRRPVQIKRVNYYSIPFMWRWMPFPGRIPVARVLFVC